MWRARLLSERDVVEAAPAGAALQPAVAAPEVVLQRCFSYSGALGRCAARGVCRDWRRVASCGAAWRSEYARRWWHVPDEDDWRAAYGARVAAERSCLRSLAAGAGATRGERPRFAAAAEGAALGAPAALLELLARVGCAAGAPFCVHQFDVGGRRGGREREPVVRRAPDRRDAARDARGYLAFLDEGAARAAVHPALDRSLGPAAAPPSERAAALARATARDRLGKSAAACVALAMERAALARATARDRLGKSAAACLALAMAALAEGRAGPVDCLEHGAARVSRGFRVFYDEVGVDAEIARLAARAAAAAAGGDEVAIVRACERVLFEGDEPLAGNAADYYNADNSFLDRVLETRKGIPISMACVLVAVAERAGVARGALRPVNAPGHFLLEYAPGGFFLDCFRRSETAAAGALSRDQVCAFVARHNNLTPENAALALERALARSPAPADVARRSVRNLSALYQGAREVYDAAALACAAVDRSLGDLPLPADAETFDRVRVDVIRRGNRVQTKLKLVDDEGLLLLPRSLAADVRGLLAALDEAEGHPSSRSPLLLPLCMGLSRLAAQANAELVAQGFEHAFLGSPRLSGHF